MLRPGFSDRLREARKRCGKTQAELAEAVGVSRVSVTQWESGNPTIATVPERDKLDRIAEVLDVTPVWLEYGIGDAVSKAKVFRAPVVPLDRIPRHKKGRTRESLMPLGESELLCPVDCSADTVAVPIEGVAMEPDFAAGMFAFVDPRAPLQPGASGRLFVLAFLNDQDAPAVRELVFDGRRRFLRATNPHLAAELIEVKNAEQIVGPVIFKGAPV